MTSTMEPRSEVVVLEPPNVAQLEAERTSLVDRVEQALPDAICSPQEYEAIAGLQREVAGFIDRYGPTFDEHGKAAYRVWKQATQIKNLFLDRPLKLNARLRDLLAGYKAQQDRIRRDEERRVAEDQRQADIARQRDEAKLLEKSGQPEMAKALRAQPVEAVAVSLPSIVPDVAGLTYRTDWYWEPVGGDTPERRAKALAMIVRPEYLAFVKWDDAALTAFAKKTKGTVRIPGIVFASRQVPVRR